MDATSITNAVAEYAKRDMARQSLENYVPFTLGFRPAKHHRYICKRLDSVMDSVIEAEDRCKGYTEEQLMEMSVPQGRRLIIAAPPGHAKSTYTSLGFAGYAMGRMQGGASIVACAHTQKFAEGWGRKVRNLCLSEKHSILFPKGVVSPNDRAASRWSTVDGNSYQAAGVGSTITGLRASILLCDDLLTGIQDANSKTIRQSISSWYFNDAKTRLKPGGSIIIIATRWHEDDLSGELLEKMQDGTGDAWEYIRMPAICDDPTNDPTGRQLGEPLWPGYIPLSSLLDIKNGGMEAREWDCLYQQNPTPKEGGAAKRDWIQRYKWGDLTKPQEGRNISILQECMIYQSWDTANSATDRSDPAVCTTFAFHPQTQNYYTLDVYRERKELADLVPDACLLAREARRRFGRLDGILIENKATGQSLSGFMKRQLLGYNILLQEPRKIGDKEFRWERATPVIEAGRFFVPYDGNERKPIVCSNPNHTWVRDYIEEIVTFPASKRDDQVDSTGQLINWREARAVRARRNRRLRIG